MPKGLFNRLLSLYPSPVHEEDYFTELVAWLFEHNQHLLFKWLRSCLNINTPYTTCHIQTQVEFEKLEGHMTSSRPDILITLYQEENQDVVMIESKIGSVEGFEQLPRYAEHLSLGFPEAQKRYLVYISRSYDPKETRHVNRFLRSNNIEFIQTRWFEFYQFLYKQPPVPLLVEILRFMKEKRMAKITKITPAVLMALNAYPDVHNFIHSVLDDEVTAKFIEIVGKKPRNEDKRLWNVAEMRRYLLIGDVNDHLIFFMGFLMPDTSDRFPSINAWFQIRPNAPDRKQHVQICKKIISDSIDQPLKWIGYDLDTPDSHAGITLETSFEEILCETDHILALKKKFLEYLSEYKRLQTAYPGLIE
jgi:hypothetical protein